MAIRVLLNTFLTRKPMKAPIAPFCALPGNAPDCAIGAFIGFLVKNVFKRTRIAISFNGVE
jgi:hypothetical protein